MKLRFFLASLLGSALLIIQSIIVPHAYAAASNIYIAQTAAGSANGTSCANAYALSFFNASNNWGNGASQIGPGTTVHLCGTFTAPAGASGYIDFQNGGLSGNPITLLFEPNAVLQAPYWGPDGAIFGGWSNANIVINGGTNGAVQSTANGTALANQFNYGGAGGPVGVLAPGGSVTIKNLTISNLYVHAGLQAITSISSSGGTTVSVSLANAPQLIIGGYISVLGVTNSSFNTPNCNSNGNASSVCALVSGISGSSVTLTYPSSVPSGSSSGGYIVDPNGGGASAITVGGSNDVVSNNTIHDTRWGINYSGSGCYSNPCSNITINGNTLWNVDHGISVGDDDNGSNSNPMTLNGPVLIYGNTIHDYGNWDTFSIDLYHHDGIHLWTNDEESSINSSNIYNNYIYGESGYNDNTDIFLNCDAGGCTINSNIYNNVIAHPASVYSPADGYVATGQGGSANFYNNTVMGFCTTAGGSTYNCPTGFDTGDNLSTVKNNIFTTLGGALGCNASTCNSITSDYDDFWNVGQFGAVSGPGNLSNLQGIGEEAHGVSNYVSAYNEKETGTTVTLTLGTPITLPSGYSTSSLIGTQVVITGYEGGCDPYNGTWALTAIPNATTIQYTDSTTGLGGGCYGSGRNTSALFKSIVGNPSLTASYYISSAGTSAASGAGANLTSLGIASLDADAAGVSRPSSGAWDIGAYQFASGGGGDTTPPSVAISSPSNNATVSSTITISGTSSDNVSVSSVAISIDGGAYSNANGTTSWSFSWNTTGVSNGSHTITAKATDSSGNTNTSQITVTVANNASGNIYISQSGSGTGSGSDCSNTHPVSWFNASGNWGSNAGQIGPGTTVHLCGTFTAPAGTSNYLTFQGGGTSGNPITLKFESGALIQAPYWSGAAIDLTSKSYVTVDGGTNGTIQATANGTNLANQQDNGECINNGFPASVSTNVTVQNVTCQNLYVDASLADNGGEDTYGFDIWNVSNLTIQNNVIHDLKWGIRNSYAINNTYSNLTIKNNTIYNIDHGWFGGDSNVGGTGAIVSNMYIYGNTVHDFANWDNALDNNHHDGFHLNANSANTRFSNFFLYDNYLYGDVGMYANAGFFSYPTANNESGVYIFNNVFINTSSNHCWADGFVAFYSVSPGPLLVTNNTLVSKAVSCKDNGLDYGASQGLTFENNIIQNTANASVYAMPNSTLSGLNYNDYSLSPSWAYNGTWYSTLASWTSATGFDTNSTVANPNLNASYIPQTGSSAIGSGVNFYSICSGQPNPGLGALCSDYAGNPRPASGAWDIGAYYVGSGGGGGDTTPPTVSLTSPTSGSTVSSTISVQASASDNVGVTKVEFYLDSALQSTNLSSPYTWNWTTASSTNGSHTLSAKAYDAAGNVGISATVNVTVSNPDTTPPSVPTGLGVTGTTTSTVALSWTASTDNVAVTGYKIFRNGTQIGTTAA
ncbi:MAG TPA: Ig-like domain-containing protein, partial [Candidatus Paceibacterota bacterium]|nr:Ig-like domain-containing protein [Candidatus Paceibacterota bacterium]